MLPVMKWNIILLIPQFVYVSHHIVVAVACGRVWRVEHEKRQAFMSPLYSKDAFFCSIKDVILSYSVINNLS